MVAAAMASHLASILLLIRKISDGVDLRVPMDGKGERRVKTISPEHRHRGSLVARAWGASRGSAASTDAGAHQDCTAGSRLSLANGRACRGWCT